MKKNLLLLIVLPTFIIPAQPNEYGLYQGTSIFPTWSVKTNGEYDKNVLTAPYQQDNPPISRAPSQIWGNNTKPFPTNRWFTTLTMSGDIAYSSDTTPPEFTQPFPVITFPYIVQPLIHGTNQQGQPTYPGLTISLPEKQLITVAGDTSTAYNCQDTTCSYLDTGTIPTPPGGSKPNYPFTSSFLNITPYSVILSCQEQEELEDPVIDSDPSNPFDVNQNLFGVTLLFKTPNDNPATKNFQRFSTSLVRGMPFVSAEFKGTTPTLQFPGQAILRFCNEANLNQLIQGKSTIPLTPATLTGSSFIVQLNSSQTWFIFTSSPITLNYDATTNQLTASEPFSGLVQIINYTTPQIQPPAIPTPLPPIPGPGQPDWHTINPRQSYAHYKDYFDDLFFPAVESWYQTTYLGTEYYNQMPQFIMPSNPTAQNIYNYYSNTYYKELETAFNTQTSPKSEQKLNEIISAALTKLQNYSGIYPTGGTIELTKQEHNPTLTIQWTSNIVATAQKPLLMLSLPHHQSLLSQPKYDATITYDTIRGPLKGVIGTNNGATWNLNYQNPGVSWHCNQKNIQNINKPEFQKTLHKYLDDDIQTLPTATDSYGFGKEIARLARLALIAHQTNYADTKKILTDIKNALKPWIPQHAGAMPKNKNPLFYDAQWGGLCTQNGLLSHEQDYGMGWYNDHHFHFGYFIYAAAVYLHLAAELQEQDSKFDPLVTNFAKELIRDIANPNNEDESFPYFRLMDWYLGHSLAAGIFPFGNGKNQESTSEAVNAWYGIYLFGVATNNNSLQNLGNTLMAAEINAAQTYWYMMPEISPTQPSINSDIYPSMFNKLTCVGVLWETKADYATFFGTNVEFINLIHFLPFTPATEVLIPQAWNTYQYELLKSSLTRKIDPTTKKPDLIQPAWRGFVHMSQAISYPQDAYNSFTQDLVTKLQPFDNGNSATNMLYWLLTRPDFTPSILPPTPPAPAPSPAPTPTPSPAPAPTPSPTPTPGPQPTPTPSPAPAPTDKIAPGLPATPQIAESMGYTGASKSIAAYVDYIKTQYLVGIINWYIQTYPSQFPTDISFNFSGSTPQDVFNSFANSDFYQTLMKHYNKHKRAYYHIPQLPAGQTRPPLPLFLNWPKNYSLNNFITQTFITTWYIPNISNKYKGYTSVPAGEPADQISEFLINIYAPAYVQWIQKLQKNK